MKKIIPLVTVLLVFLLFSHKAHAVYDPISVVNNRFGIHILFPEEIFEAAHLVNSNGGEWGYLTIPIRASDRNIEKWQTFMDNARNNKIIPIIRLATEGDYFNKTSWSKPTDYDTVDFANFLNALSWPTKNRYVVIYNEVNRGDEWGGNPNAAEYARILSSAVDIFKEKNSDFFIIMAGLDNASVNNAGQSIDEYNFMDQMEAAETGIYAKIDGVASHSYPNPGFSSAPTKKQMGIYSFFYQKQIADYYSGKNLPIFITETGWSSETIPLAVQSQYYIQSFNEYWNKDYVIAVTPFIFNASQGDFTKFSFLINNQKTSIYQNYLNFPKTKGQPILTKKSKNVSQKEKSFPTKRFIDSPINSVFEKINSSSKEFFKWLLKA